MSKGPLIKKSFITLGKKDKLKKRPRIMISSDENLKANKRQTKSYAYELKINDSTNSQNKNNFNHVIFNNLEKLDNFINFLLHF